MAEWIELSNMLKCSECEYALKDEQMYISKNYCPNCGTKMNKNIRKCDKECETCKYAIECWID